MKKRSVLSEHFFIKRLEKPFAVPILCIRPQNGLSSGDLSFFDTSKIVLLDSDSLYGS